MMNRHKPGLIVRSALAAGLLAAVSPSMYGQSPVGQGAPSAQAAGPSPEAMKSFQSQMRDLRQQAEECGERVRSAQAALRSIKEQMAESGLDMRRDVREAEARMTYLLDKTKAEIDAGDAVSAEADLRMANYAADYIERFLGRGD